MQTTNAPTNNPDSARDRDLLGDTSLVHGKGVPGAQNRSIPRCSQGKAVSRICSTAIGLLMFAVAAGGCASTKSTVESRKLERLGAYESLSAEQQELVDQGLIQAGMPPDAVYISWGKPAQVLQSGNQSGVTTTWLYHGTTTDEYLGWSYYQTPSPDGGYFLSRRLDRDYNTREYISAELTFRNGELLEWKMLPKPSGNTIYRGYP